MNSEKKGSIPKSATKRSNAKGLEVSNRLSPTNSWLEANGISGRIVAHVCHVSEGNENTVVRSILWILSENLTRKKRHNSRIPLPHRTMTTGLDSVFHSTSLINGFHHPLYILGSLWVYDTCRSIESVVQVPGIVGSFSEGKVERGDDDGRAEFGK
jgi:hypothetical protein